MAADLRVLHVVCYGEDFADLGVLVEDGEHLVVCWPDGNPDPARRDRRGWYWHEHGVRLPVLSGNRGDARPLLARFAKAFEADVGHAPFAESARG